MGSTGIGGKDVKFLQLRRSWSYFAGNVLMRADYAHIFILLKISVAPAGGDGSESDKRHQDATGVGDAVLPAVGSEVIYIKAHAALNLPEDKFENKPTPYVVGLEYTFYESLYCIISKLCECSDHKSLMLLTFDMSKNKL